MAFEVLGHYPVPDYLKKFNWRIALKDEREFMLQRIERDLTAFILPRASLGAMDIATRGPWYELDDPRVREWHRDGDAFRTAVFWSNIPPDLRTLEGQPLIAIPCDVIKIDNYAIEHRMPKTSSDRWFYRLVAI